MIINVQKYSNNLFYLFCLLFIFLLHPSTCSNQTKKKNSMMQQCEAFCLLHNEKFVVIFCLKILEEKKFIQHFGRLYDDENYFLEKSTNVECR